MSFFLFLLDLLIENSYKKAPSETLTKIIFSIFLIKSEPKKEFDSSFYKKKIQFFIDNKKRSIGRLQNTPFCIYDFQLEDRIMNKIDKTIFKFPVENCAGWYRCLVCFAFTQY